MVTFIPPEGLLIKEPCFICYSWKNRGRRSGRPGKQKQTVRTMGASLMTWCLRCDRVRSSTRTCPRWSVIASGSTTRTQTRAGSDHSQSSTSRRPPSSLPAPFPLHRFVLGSDWPAHSSAPSSFTTQLGLNQPPPRCRATNTKRCRLSILLVVDMRQSRSQKLIKFDQIPSDRSDEAAMLEIERPSRCGIRSWLFNSFCTLVSMHKVKCAASRLLQIWMLNPFRTIKENICTDWFHRLRAALKT